MPGIEEHETRDKVEHVGRKHGDDERDEDSVREQEAEGEGVLGELSLDGFDGDEDRSE